MNLNYHEATKEFNRAGVIPNAPGGGYQGSVANQLIRRKSRPATAKEAQEAAANLRKIMKSKGAITEGFLPKGKVAVSKRVEKDVPVGYIAVVNSTTHKFKRIPLKAFEKSLKEAGLGKKTYDSMVAKARKGDREIFTSNQKVISHFSLGKGPVTKGKAIRTGLKPKKGYRVVEDKSGYKGVGLAKRFKYVKI